MTLQMLCEYYKKVLHVISSTVPSFIDMLRVEIINKKNIEKEVKVKGYRRYNIRQTGFTESTNSTDKFVPKIHGKKGSKFVKSKKFSFPNENIVEFRNVKLIGKYGFCITRERKTIKRVYCRENQKGPQSFLREVVKKRPVHTAKNMIAGESSGSEKIKRAICLNTTLRPNYYTWAAIELLKLRAAERYKSETGKAPTLIIPDDDREYVQGSLSLLGYDETEWVVASESLTEIERLIAPTYPQPCPSNLHWIGQQMRSRLVEREYDESLKQDRVYLSRSKAGRRQVVNEKALMEELNKIGFKRYCPEDLEFDEQVYLIANASIVVSPHGASLCNIMWGKSISVVEIFNDIATEPYNIFAKNLNHRYFAFRGTSVKPKCGKHSDIYVDTKNFRSFLRTKVVT